MIEYRELPPSFRFTCPPKGLFELGLIVATSGAAEAFEEAGIQARDLMLRHISGDWGDIRRDDVSWNEAALEHGLRINSLYILPRTWEAIWIVTEGDRSLTTIMTKREY